LENRKWKAESQKQDGDVKSPLQQNRGAEAEEKVGLLRSVPKDHPGCKKRK
jgi:hypothetical protein